METTVHSDLEYRTDPGGFAKRPAGAGPRALPDVPAGEHYRPLNVRRGGEGLANFLGWFSLGLGLSQIIAPDGMARLIGMRPTDKTRDTMRALGMREITSGMGILSQKRQSDWLWSRVAGDAMDLALLGRVTVDTHDGRERNTAAILAVAGVAALDVLAATQVGKRTGSLLQGRPDDNGRGPGAGGRDNFNQESRRMRSTGGTGTGRNTDGGINTGLSGARAKSRSGLRRTTNVITVNRPTEEVYEFWRNFENLPRFMRHLESVKVLDNGRSRWKAMAPAGMSVEWEAEMTEDRPGELISWRSLPGSQVRNAGTVRFSSAPGGRGTEVRVDLEYAPPAGMVGTMVAKLFREEPGQQVHDDLRHFKQVLELGEIVLSDASAHKGMHPAQPSDKPVEMKV
jgi:uncharacterized membrane protein